MRMAGAKYCSTIYASSYNLKTHWHIIDIKKANCALGLEWVGANVIQNLKNLYYINIVLRCPTYFNNYS